MAERSSLEYAIVTYGPGDSFLGQTPDEHVDLDEYDKAIYVYAEDGVVAPSKDGGSCPALGWLVFLSQS